MTLEQLLPTIQKDVPLASFTTFKIGGKVSYFTQVATKEELKQVVQAARQCGVPVFVLGGGSNILVADEGIDGLVVRIGLKGVSFQDRGDVVLVEAAAGENWDDVVAQSVERRLFGLENLSGIPGTVGAAPVQNIGAYGAELKDVFVSLEVFNQETLEWETKTGEECRFGYRDSIFKSEGNSWIIISVALELQKNGKAKTHYKDIAKTLQERGIEDPNPAVMREIVLGIRSKKFPSLEEMGTAGSFFKNPVVSEKLAEKLKEQYPDMPAFPANPGAIKLSAAWILDAVCNLKGKKEGSVGAFERQPLVLVNYGGASAKEIFAFARKIQQEVKEKTGIDFEFEVRLVGNWQKSS